MTSAELTYLAANWTNDSNMLTRHQTHQLKNGVAFHDHALGRLSGSRIGNYNEQRSPLP